MKRLVLWPVAVVAIAFALIVFTQPEALSGAPVDTARVGVER